MFIHRLHPCLPLSNDLLTVHDSCQTNRFPLQRVPCWSTQEHSRARIFVPRGGSVPKFCAITDPNLKSDRKPAVLFRIESRSSADGQLLDCQTRPRWTARARPLPHQLAIWPFPWPMLHKSKQLAFCKDTICVFWTRMRRGGRKRMGGLSVRGHGSKLRKITFSNGNVISFSGRLNDYVFLSSDF